LATSQVSLVGNLDAREPLPQNEWNPQDPSGTARISAILDVHDANGAPHEMGLYFRKADVNRFEYHVVIASEALQRPETAPNAEVGSGALQFDTDGGLDAVEQTELVQFRFTGTTSDQVIELNFGSPKSEGGSGRDGLTQYALETSINYQSANE